MIEHHVETSTAIVTVVTHPVETIEAIVEKVWDNENS
jgi:hypothetical protein